MGDDAIRLATIGQMIRRRGRLLAVLALVGALVGYGASLVFPPRYTASASVLLAGQWEERELATQQEIATSSAVVDRSAAALGWGMSGLELKEDVAAEAADGNIIRISGTADSPERAQRLADQVAAQYVAFAAGLAGDTADSDAALAPEELRKLVAQTSRRITELAAAADPGRSVETVQGRTELEKLRTALRDAIKKLDEVGPATNKANLLVMGPAVRPDGEAPPTRLQLVLGGALLFLLLGVVAHLTAARVSRRLRSEPEIAAALGSALLGSVDVPRERSARRPEGGGLRLRRFLGLDDLWDVPVPQASGGEAGRRIRYRRVCTRLRGRLAASARRVLVLVPEGDAVARSAAGQLVAEAGGDPELEVVEVSVTRPMVPEQATGSQAVIVLSTGSRTAEELAQIAEACADARQELLGIVLAGAVRTGQEPETDRPAEETPEPVAVGADPKGGTA
ncbi:polysaccharide biosynthesis protein [Streptomyces sp. KLOTTS4A1]|uniref:polysaccharide biosynthesis protein n=1 Tax=Streptomyces sp. KLOTTS4A1 TaxID=3390996 RepID=UPI0039F4F546